MMSATGTALQLESGGQRSVIRELGQGIGVMDCGSNDAKATSVDAIEPEHRQHGGKGPRRPSARDLEHFDHAQFLLQRAISLAPPVVEVAGDDERLVHRNLVANALAQGVHLPAPSALEQAKMDVEAMQRGKPSLRVHYTVEEAA